MLNRIYMLNMMGRFGHLGYMLLIYSLLLSQYSHTDQSIPALLKPIRKKIQNRKITSILTKVDDKPITYTKCF